MEILFIIMFGRFLREHVLIAYSVSSAMRGMPTEKVFYFWTNQIKQVETFLKL